ncbi:MAG TPA: MFS transporter [Micromonosporaceae bacterium]|nr:MFS transporter [Micromonosporaceae bacterium]
MTPSLPATRPVRRSLVAILAAETISRVGTRMSMVALPWFVLVLTGSPARTGLVAFAEMTPYVLACAFGGPLLDRIGVRRASIVADATSAAVVVAIPLLYRDASLGFGTLLGLVALAGLLRGLGDTAKQAVFPQTVAESGVDMTRAASLHDGLSRLAGLLGAPLAGLLIALLDAPTVLLVDAATFAAGAVLVGLLVPRPATAAGQSGSNEREPYLRALRAGWQFLRGDRLLLAISLMLVATNLFDQAFSGVLAPVWARDVAGTAVALGLLTGAFSVGAVLGNLVFTAVAPRAPRWAVFSIGFLVAGSPKWVVMALVPDLWVVYAVSFLGGLGAAALNPILGAVLYERVPEPLHARVFGMSLALSWAGIPLGGLVGGLLVQWLGLTSALLVLAALYLGATLLPFVDRTWRRLDDRPAKPAAAEPAVV